MYVVKRCDVGVVEYFPNVDGKTTRVQLEVDFVISRGNLRHYIQLALSHMFDNHRKEYINNWK